MGGAGIWGEPDSTDCALETTLCSNIDVDREKETERDRDRGRQWEGEKAEREGRGMKKGIGREARLYFKQDV